MIINCFAHLLDACCGICYYKNVKVVLHPAHQIESLRRVKVKRFLALLLALVMLMSLTACGGDDVGSNNDDGNETNEITEKLKNAEVGDVVTFGRYEQDNDTSNGKESIQWLVIAKEDGRLLVISKYILDYQQYSERDSGTTWEICSLREWLNDDFISSAFSEEEQALIPAVTISADKNSSQSTAPRQCDKRSDLFAQH